MLKQQEIQQRYGRAAIMGISYHHKQYQPTSKNQKWPTSYEEESESFRCEYIVKPTIYVHNFT